MTRVVEIAAWWVVGLLLWLATVSPVTVEEVVPAVICALACAPAARAARQAVGARWRMRARWFGWTRWLPTAVVADTARLARHWWGRPQARGVIRRTTLDTASDRALAVTHRALAAVVLSAAPGSVVLDIEGDDVLLHAITPNPARLEKAARR
jgi:multisubunit Na+/H+ antiporter MnhE subunit